MLLNYGILTQRAIVSIIILIALSICFWNMMDLFLPKVITIPNFTRHSFLIFALHINVSAVVTKLLFFVLPKSPYISLLNFVLTTIITLIGIEMVCYIIEKISHPIYSLLSGSR